MGWVQLSSMVRELVTQISACNHRRKQIFGATNIDLGLVSSHTVQAIQTQFNI